VGVTRAAGHADGDALVGIGADVAGAETAAVAKEVAVDLVVVAVHHATQRAVALAGRDVAAHAAAGADGGRGLQVPLAHVALAEGLVREDAGRAHLGQVAGEFAFQRAVRGPAEIGVVVRGLGHEVGATGVVAVEAHAAVAGDAAV